MDTNRNFISEHCINIEYEIVMTNIAYFRIFNINPI
jgi:hypothetical protein